jgi:hypothetical protein
MSDPQANRRSLQEPYEGENQRKLRHHPLFKKIMWASGVLATLGAAAAVLPVLESVQPFMTKAAAQTALAQHEQRITQIEVRLGSMDRTGLLSFQLQLHTRIDSINRSLTGPNMDEEFADPTTGEVKFQPGFLDDLEKLRVEYDKPMIGTSGCRTTEHNEWLLRRGYKASPNSLHLIGNEKYGTDTCAVDIARPNGADAHLLVKLATKHLWTVGWAKTFIHLDRRAAYTDLPAIIYDYL